MPSFAGTLWRGVVGDVSASYKKGDIKILWAFSSCTSNMDVLQQAQFLGDSGPRTLFCIEARSAKDIRAISAICNEDELLLLAGTMVQVLNVSKQARHAVPLLPPAAFRRFSRPSRLCSHEPASAAWRALKACPAVPTFQC